MDNSLKRCPPGGGSENRRGIEIRGGGKSRRRGVGDGGGRGRRDKGGSGRELFEKPSGIVGCYNRDLIFFVVGGYVNKT